MIDIIWLTVVMVCVCLLCAAWIGLTERGHGLDDWFRKRWGGSDARPMEKDDE